MSIYTILTYESATTRTMPFLLSLSYCLQSHNFAQGTTGFSERSVVDVVWRSFKVLIKKVCPKRFHSTAWYGKLLNA